MNAVSRTKDEEIILNEEDLFDIKDLPPDLITNFAADILKFEKTNLSTQSDEEPITVKYDIIWDCKNSSGIDSANIIYKKIE